MLNVCFHADIRCDRQNAVDRHFQPIPGGVDRVLRAAANRDPATTAKELASNPEADPPAGAGDDCCASGQIRHECSPSLSLMNLFPVIFCFRAKEMTSVSNETATS
jgi:hypothetical protein